MGSGSKITFVGISKEVKEGMSGHIKIHVPNEEIVIEYDGVIENGKERTEGADIEKWIGACEFLTHDKFKNSSTEPWKMREKLWDHSLLWKIWIRTKLDFDPLAQHYGRRNRKHCGWCRDTFGVWWQVVPSVLGSLMSDPEKAPKVMKAFMQMKKFDIAALLKAADE
ncbi:hypothetical protein FQR65_LT19583 [Abscondita terminalis]|nr:hypothetical protein FQR65_LT19583 [Abscondita terminalis]